MDKEVVKECLKMTNEAEEIVQCPLCFEMGGTMVQCTVGHHICDTCRSKVNEVCPICRSSFAGTKCFLVKDLTKIINKLKISLNHLDESPEATALSIDKAEKYKKLTQKLLIELSTFLKFTGSSLTFVSKYLEHPNYHDKSELESHMVSWTSKFQNVTKLMDDTKDTLTTLKKK